MEEDTDDIADMFYKLQEEDRKCKKQLKERSVLNDVRFRFQPIHRQIYHSNPEVDVQAASDRQLPREEILPSFSRAYITSSAKEDKNNDASTVKFEGMNIRPNLFPTLQKIWSKHGNIVENSLISNGDNIARLLESLASSNYDTHP
ncbi:hypothetical protein SOVF_062690 [Spinacia oleracea]|uniref:Uncharacterized protein n=1 Tax=Spinacia oleracea TaxID=3562 RepID=A0ABM3QP65_SPIOL|nr:uncharacterized protein LOC130461188 [Spinacia oleracea]KNA19285.1 hypothetical protein SOVF_062690 [Spinacia oleracea]